jgi:DNA polymerase-3 subunit delta
MRQLRLDAFRTQIAEDALQPIYVLGGEDAIGKAAAVDELLDTVDEALRPFNVDRLDASNATNAAAREGLASELLAAARTLPMMAPRRIVILQRADALLFPKGKKDEEEGGESETIDTPRRGKKGAANDDPIEAYVESPECRTTLVLVVESLPQNRRIGKLLAEKAVVVSFGTEMSEREAADWIERQARAATIAIDGAAVRALISRTGGNAVRLRSALERVLLYAMGQTKISADDVNQAIPASPDAPENFGIANAIRRSDAAGALRELHLALDAGGAPFYVLGQLRSAAEGFPSPRLRDAIEAVFRTDLALKSSGGEPRVLLERLVVELSTLGKAERGVTPRR